MRRFIDMFALLLTMVTTIYAQSEDVPRYEVGAQFSSVTIKEPDSVPVGFPNGVNQDLIRSFRTEPGLGGRFTVNLSPNIAFEAETNFFPNDNGTRTYYSGGRTLQVVAGAKLGKRIEQFGFFGKGDRDLFGLTRCLVTRAS